MSKFEHLKARAQQHVTPKRAIVAGAILLLAVILGRDTISYLTTASRMLGDRVRSSVPLEFELERARTMISDMLPNIRQNMMLIAQEEVGVEQVRRDVKEAEAALAAQRDDLLRLRADLENQEGAFLVGTRPATPVEVRAELTRRFNRYQTAEATVDAKQQLLQAREQSLSAAREKLDEMLNAKRDLEVEVENLTARLQTIQNKPTSPDIEFDDTQVARCQQLVDDLRLRLEVADRLLNSSGDFDTLLTAGYVPSEEDIAMQIDQYFQDE